jgi:hypothetical protein
LPAESIQTGYARAAYHPPALVAFISIFKRTMVEAQHLATGG